MGKIDMDWVAQKYIERPLILNKKKVKLLYYNLN